KYKHTGLGPWYDEMTSALLKQPVVRTGAWFDQTTRLYRFLEYVETQDRAYGVTSDGGYDQGSFTLPGSPTVYTWSSGVSSVGRRPGKVNINTVWDPEILQALFDSQTSNYFSINDVGTSINAAGSIYANLISSRTPGYAAATAPGSNPLQALSPLDRPFMGMATGNTPYNDPF